MLKKYNKKSNFSYSVGVFPTLELLHNKSKHVLKVLVSPKGHRNTGVDEIMSLCKKLGIRVEESQKSIDFVSKSGNTYAVAVFQKYQSALDEKHNHLVLVNPSDMGNLGTICRTMLAFGFRDLAIIKPGVDVFDPKVGRASMGAIHKINIQYFDSFDEYLRSFNKNIYSFMIDGKNLLSDISFKQPYSLVFGNEGAGLDDVFKKYGQSVKIEQTNDVDSLNLSIAVGICLHKAGLKK